MGISGDHLKLVLVAFSARSLVEAAAAATHFLPFAVDHFADHDCRENSASCTRISCWGGQVSEFAALVRNKLPVDATVLFGGGLENWPELVGWLHENFTVLGPTPEQLRQLRSQDFWQHCCQDSPIRFPEIRSVRDGAPLPGSGGWLSKPVRGAGGLAVRRAGNFLAPSNQPRYWQREVLGRALGAHCILAPDRSVLLGVTESFDSSDWPGPSEFIYRGSWGPIEVRPQHEQQILELCERIRLSTGAIGWHQFDFIEDPQGTLWLLEVNPRWAAGMEVLFLAGINPVEFQLSAWGLGVSATPQESRGAGVGAKLQFGKAIVYANQELELDLSGIARLHALPRSNFVDLPAFELAGQSIASGHPLLTVRAKCVTAGSAACVRAGLLNELDSLRAEALRQL